VSQPVVGGLDPGDGPQAGGSSVSISGSGFDEVVGVAFGAEPAESFVVDSPTAITAIAPAGSSTVDVFVTTALGGASEPGPGDRFSYFVPPPLPGVKKIKPAKGPAAGGTRITISGTELADATGVLFGQTPAAGFEVLSNTSIVAVAPEGTTGDANVTVVTPGGSSAQTRTDEFAFGAPTITQVSPNSGSIEGGGPVTVTGSGFALGARTLIKFAKRAASNIECASTTTCVVVAPPSRSSGAVEIRATVDKKTSTKDRPADLFRYE
jgi:hypothetical protein